jgi:hypothetical protein
LSAFGITIYNNNKEKKMSQHFLYKHVRKDALWFKIFEISEVGDSKLLSMYPGQPTRTYCGSIEQMRDLWTASKRAGWKDKAKCACGNEMDAGWYIHIGQCQTCECQDELEIQHEEEWFQNQMDG